MKKIFSILMLLSVVLACMSSCGKKTELSQSNPVTLTMWHVYGEQSDSPMNRLVEEFNRTQGREKGIVINVTSMTNASRIGNLLLEAQKDNPGSTEMPDLFFCHNNNAEALGKDNLVNWKSYFSEEELSAFVPEFLSDGTLGDNLSVFPVSKSTHLLFIAGGVFDRFSAETGVTYQSLSTWDGFFDTAEKYYEWSGGKPFCSLDYPLRCIELNAMSKGASEFYTEDGWYDFSNEIFMASFSEFASAISKGHVVVSDLYSNTQVMTGEVASGIGSSASILYYNDTITYPDNTKEPMNLKVVPLPQSSVGNKLVTQAGVGLVCYKTTTQKAEAASVFVKWLTQSDRNLDFVVETGYMPVHKNAFDKIESYEFKDQAYTSLYKALRDTNKNCKAVTEPSFAGYYKKVSTLCDGIRAFQRQPESYNDSSAFEKKITELFRSVK